MGSYGFLSASCGFLSLASAHETAAKASILEGSYGFLSASFWFLSLAFAHETAAKAHILVGSYGFLLASCGFLSLAFVWASYGLPMGFLWAPAEAPWKSGF